MKHIAYVQYRRIFATAVDESLCNFRYLKAIDEGWKELTVENNGRRYYNEHRKSILIRMARLARMLSLLCNHGESFSNTGYTNTLRKCCLTFVIPLFCTRQPNEVIRPHLLVKPLSVHTTALRLAVTLSINCLVIIKKPTCHQLCCRNMKLAFER